MGVYCLGAPSLLITSRDGTYRGSTFERRRLCSCSTMPQPYEKNSVSFSTQLVANDFMRMAYASFVFCYGLSTVHYYGKENPYKPSYGAWDALSLYPFSLGNFVFCPEGHASRWDVSIDRLG